MQVKFPAVSVPYTELSVASVAVPLTTTCWPTPRVVPAAAQENAPAVPVAYTVLREVLLGVPLTLTTVPTDKAVPPVYANRPEVLVAYALPRDVDVVDPLMLIVCPAASPVVAVQANCPAVPVRYTPDKEAVVDAVAAADNVTVLPTTEDTVPLTPVPVTVWPAPTRTLAAVSTTEVLPFVVFAVAVNNPTLDIEAAAVKVKPVGVPAVVVTGVPPKVVDSVNVVEPLVAVMVCWA